MGLSKMPWSQASPDTTLSTAFPPGKKCEICVQSRVQSPSAYFSPWLVSHLFSREGSEGTRETRESWSRREALSAEVFVPTSGVSRCVCIRVEMTPPPTSHTPQGRNSYTFSKAWVLWEFPCWFLKRQVQALSQALRSGGSSGVRWPGCAGTSRTWGYPIVGCSSDSDSSQNFISAFSPARIPATSMS